MLVDNGKGKKPTPRTRVQETWRMIKVVLAVEKKGRAEMRRWVGGWVTEMADADRRHM